MQARRRQEFHQVPLLEWCQVCTRKGGGCGSVKAGCLMHSFPLPGSPGAAEPCCGRVCWGWRCPTPTPGSPWPPACLGVHEGEAGGCPCDSRALIQRLLQCVPVHSGFHSAVPALRTQRRGWYCLVAQLRGGQARCLYPPHGPLPRQPCRGRRRLRFWQQQAGKREAGSAGKAAGAVRTRGCEGWSSCGPSQCRSWAAGPH